jgi:hypothetical protein
MIEWRSEVVLPVSDSTLHYKMTTLGSDDDGDGGCLRQHRN